MSVHLKTTFSEEYVLFSVVMKSLGVRTEDLGHP